MDRKNSLRGSDLDRWIVRQIGEGASNKEIASTVGRAESTVKWRTSRLMRQIGAHSRAALVGRIDERPKAAQARTPDQQPNEAPFC